MHWRMESKTHYINLDAKDIKAYIPQANETIHKHVNRLKKKGNFMWKSEQIIVWTPNRFQGLAKVVSTIQKIHAFKGDNKFEQNRR